MVQYTGNTMITKAELIEFINSIPDDYPRINITREVPQALPVEYLPNTDIINKISEKGTIDISIEYTAELSREDFPTKS